MTLNVLIPGGPANTAMVPVASSPDREAMVQPKILQRPVCWLISKASNGFNGKRMTGTGWNEALPEMVPPPQQHGLELDNKAFGLI